MKGVKSIRIVMEFEGREKPFELDLIEGQNATIESLDLRTPVGEVPSSDYLHRNLMHTGERSLSIHWIDHATREDFIRGYVTDGKDRQAGATKSKT